ncbi:DUF2306 domain-containing protein [Nonomuraea sp. NPDC004354]
MTDESPAGRQPLPQPSRAGRLKDGRSEATAPSSRAGWLVPTALIVLGAVPVVAGAVRLTELAGGAAITPENGRFFAAPLPVVLHIIGACVYSVLGAFQFAAGFRRRRPGWHRVAGRLLVPCGLLAALAGLWMSLFYPRPEGDGALLAGFRLVFGAAMVLSLALGLAAIRRRDVAGHRAWMVRGYAIGLGAGTQAVVLALWFLLIGTPGEISRALLLGGSWVINLAVAERIIRGGTRPSQDRWTRLVS